MNFLKCVALVLIGLVAIYLFGALVGWDLNPGKWSGLLRFFCAALTATWLFGLFGKEDYG